MEGTWKRVAPVNFVPKTQIKKFSLQSYDTPTYCGHSIPESYDRYPMTSAFRKFSITPSHPLPYTPLVALCQFGYGWSSMTCNYAEKKMRCLDL